MKKFLSLILALLMIVSCASVIFAAEEAAEEAEAVAEEAAAEEAPVATTASDDEKASDYYDAVNFLVSYGIMHGKGDTLGVYDNIKRYEMALFVGRILTGWVSDDAWEDGSENSSEFIDLDGTAAQNFYGAISYVNQHGIIEGVGGKRFAPVSGIKYEDALTMAVRALGYKDLAYPWGYIDKAVNLGLTKGISGIAYAETLKREVVAQIIYNTLFAENSDGETLAHKNFDLDLNYEVVMITASDAAHYQAGAKNAPAGFVAYQVVNADGSLNDQIYLESAASFGLTGAHDDEVALGTVYKVLFNKNSAATGLGNLVSAESLEMDTVWNLGLNSKEAGVYPVQAFLTGVKLVSAYSAKNVFNQNVSEFILVTDDTTGTRVIRDGVAVDWTTGDILVKNEMGVYEVRWYYNQLLNRYFRYNTVIKDNGDITLVGIEYMTWDELSKIYALDGAEDTKTEDYTYAVAKKAPAASAYASLRLFDLNEDDAADYGIYDEFRLGYYSTAAIDAINKDSTVTNASLEDTFKTDDSDKYTGIPGYGDGHEVTLGANDDRNLILKSEIFTGPVKIGNDTVTKDDAVKTVETYNVTFGQYESLSILNFDNALNGVVVNDARLMPNYGEYIYLKSGDKGIYKQYTNVIPTDALWSQEQYAPATDAEGNAVDGYVLYSLNLSTDELKVLKTIGEYEEGSDTYVATGILRAFDMSKKILTIGDQVFSTQYDELAGTAFNTENYNSNGYWWAGTQYVSSLFNQFVTYVVVDGVVVYVEACGAEDARFLVVDGYAGMSRDGYIVINAWDTADGANKRIRIASCDGWRFGDLFYYDSHYAAEAEKLFADGTILQVLSYNSETDAYGVTALPEIDTKAGTRQSVKAKYGTGTFDFTWFTFGYQYAKIGLRLHKYNNAWYGEPRNWTKFHEFSQDSIFSGAGMWNGSAVSGAWDGRIIATQKNMSADDTYILIFDKGEVVGSPIRIFKGVVTDATWTIEGWRLDSTGNKTHVFMGLKAENVNGFGMEASVATHGLVMIPNYTNDKNENYYAWMPEEVYAEDSVGGTAYQAALGKDITALMPTDLNAWGYVINGAYDTGDLVGNTEYAVTVLDLVTLKTITVAASDLNMKPNFVYETINGKVVGDPIPANQLRYRLMGYAHEGYDLANDTIIVYDTEGVSNFADGCQTATGIEKEQLNATGINQKLTKAWLGHSTVDFGTYTIPIKAKYVSMVTVHEGIDGHAEIEIVATEAANNKFHTNGFDTNPVLKNADILKRTKLWDADKKNQTEASAYTIVTIVNMSAVRLGVGTDPYVSGQFAIHYIFNQDAFNQDVDGD